MRVPKSRAAPRRELHRLIEQLDGLPLRPLTVRSILADLDRRADDATIPFPPDAPWKNVADLDPGWAFAQSRANSSSSPLNPFDLIADRPWWVSRVGLEGETRSRFWRHSVAVALAAHRLAREANEPDPDRLARAGLLHGLGVWVVAAVDIDLVTRRCQIVDPDRRRDYEIETLGAEWARIGRDLAERWGADPLVADAAWLHGDLGRGTERAARDPERIALIQQAHALAERTPWAFASPDQLAIPDRISHDPRVRLLVAEVQARCGGPFVDLDASGREERLTRSNASLRNQVVRLKADQAERDRLLNALAETPAHEGVEAWSERVGLAWCETPGATAAAVVRAGQPPEPGAPARPPTVEVPLVEGPGVGLSVHLWAPEGLAVSEPLVPAWRAWARLVSDRERLDARLAEVHRALRRRSEAEGPRLRYDKLSALAEFAAGAGHELNNPLAVIVGRAQLLLGGETDPKSIRSLRAILTQAQRAHRILRDLMYVARPAEPRPRSCQPDEVVKASLRDLAVDADERDLQLTFEPAASSSRAWVDPDGLRQLADALVRNALEATPRGGSVRVRTEGDAGELRWTIEDNGPGISAIDGVHLFDPFYCGRAAGRGLGMGLPRAARFVENAGGEIRWNSTTGQGATFTVRLPLQSPPRPPSVEAESRPHALSEPGAVSPGS